MSHESYKRLRVVFAMALVLADGAMCFLYMHISKMYQYSTTLDHLEFFGGCVSGEQVSHSDSTLPHPRVSYKKGKRSKPSTSTSQVL